MKKITHQHKKLLYTAAAAVFWLLVWQAVAMLYNMDFVLPTPLKTLSVLAQNIAKARFWSAILFSVSRILLGFLLSCIVGASLALLSIKIKAVKILFDPFCSVVRAVPVASFIILVLVIFSSKYVSVVISFLMGFPVIYSTLQKGIDASPEPLLEAADVFCMGYFKKLRYIYFPHLLPYTASALSVSAGLCFKSGIAAEVIGYPSGSVGEAMYLSKIGFDMPGLLSYTAVIVVISVLCEKAIMLICRMPGTRGEAVK